MKSYFDPEWKTRSWASLLCDELIWGGRSIFGTDFIGEGYARACWNGDAIEGMSIVGETDDPMNWPLPTEGTIACWRSQCFSIVMNTLNLQNLVINWQHFVSHFRICPYCPNQRRTLKSTYLTICSRGYLTFNNGTVFCLQTFTAYFNPTLHIRVLIWSSFKFNNMKKYMAVWKATKFSILNLKF